MRFTRTAVVLGVSGFIAAGVWAASLGFTPVPSANPRITATAAPNMLPPELTLTPVAQGSFAVENPGPAVAIPSNCPGNSTNGVGYYGYDTDGTMLPNPAGDLPTSTHKVEATKTEPDENTYLILRNQHGPDPSYDYGTHFLFQGHELGRGYITRINLDADGPHRVTILATYDSTPTPTSTNPTPGCPLPTIDGSGWDPFAHKLLFTSESAGNQSILQASPDYPSMVNDLTPWMGKGAYEAVLPDDYGRIYLVEDAGGAAGTATGGVAPLTNLSKSKQPNSFVYRFVPYVRSDLQQGGQLQVLQIQSLAHPGQPIKFTIPAVTPPATTPTAAQIADAANADILSLDVKDLHTYGKTFDTKWITIHDTAVSGTTWTGTANALAKSMGGTPFKRPENGRFRPGSRFNEFVFDETGDTDNTAGTGVGGQYGQFGAIFRLKELPGNTGKLTLVYTSMDPIHAGFDNVSFWDEDHVVLGEDAGDGLHGQRNALDSAWLFNLKTDYSNPANQPKRIVAEGRDPSATLDTTFAGKTGYQNEGDNEITGWITSDGDAGIDGILGAKIPTPFRNGWRTFWTQQHGDNFTWELLPSDRDDFVKDHDHDRDDDRRFGHDHRRDNDRDDDDRGYDRR